MRMGQGVRTGLGHGGITCVIQTQFSSGLSNTLFVSPVHIHGENLHYDHQLITVNILYVSKENNL